jgi:hypothetical protein
VALVIQLFSPLITYSSPCLEARAHAGDIAAAARLGGATGKHWLLGEHAQIFCFCRVAAELDRRERSVLASMLVVMPVQP